MAVDSTQISQKNSGKKKFFLWFILFVFVGTAALCVAGLYYFLNLPLNQSLQTTPGPPTADSSGDGSAQVPASVCSNSGSEIILVIGADLPETDPPKGADAIRFIKVDYSNQAVTILAVPRDLWVVTPSLLPHGHSATRLGETYFHGKNIAPTAEDGVWFGTSVLAQTFYDNFSVIPDHYITLNMEAFAQMVDSIGGIRINIPQPFEGAKYSFSAGDQIITGEMLMDYSRTFMVGTEWDRIERQNVALNAIKNNLLSGELLPEIPMLFAQFSDIVFTDLSPQQFINLGCMINTVPNENIHWLEISADMIITDADDRMLPVPDELIPFIEDLFSD